MEPEETQPIRNGARGKNDSPVDKPKSFTAKASDSPAKVVPRSQAINVRKALESQPIPTGQDYIVYAYLLASNPSNVLGVQIYLGAYDNKARALNVAKNIMQKTGVASIYVTESGRCTPIDQSHKLDRTGPIANSPEMEEAIRNVFKEEKEREMRNLERQAQIESEITAEMSKREDQSTVEAYAYNWYAYTKDRLLYAALTERAEHLSDKIAERAERLRLQYSLHPELDNNGKWIEDFKGKLANRGEAPLAATIEGEYRNSRDLVLSKDSEEENGPSDATHLLATEEDSNQRRGSDSESATKDPVQVIDGDGIHELPTEALANGTDGESY